jgi:hypothetical protein
LRRRLSGAAAAPRPSPAAAAAVRRAAHPLRLGNADCPAGRAPVPSSIRGSLFRLPLFSRSPAAGVGERLRPARLIRFANLHCTAVFRGPFRTRSNLDQHDFSGTRRAV